MKCPNCASDVPDVSNFCGVCGFDMRPARQAAELAQQTMAMESETEVQALREQLERPVTSQAEVSADTMMDSAPSLSSADSPSDQPEKNATAVRAPAPAPVAESPAFAPDVTTTQGVQINVSPNETFASMEAITPPAGGFRETQWFMAAQDPDHIENIENVVPTDLEGQYQKSEILDTQARQQFSLNVGKNSGGTHGAGTSDDGYSENVRGGAGPNKVVVGVLVLIVLGAVAYFGFMR